MAQGRPGWQVFWQVCLAALQGHVFLLLHLVLQLHDLLGRDGLDFSGGDVVLIGEDEVNRPGSGADVVLIGVDEVGMARGGADLIGVDDEVGMAGCCVVLIGADEVGGVDVVIIGEMVEFTGGDGDTGDDLSGIYFLFLQSFPLWQKLLQSIPFFMQGHLRVLQVLEQLHLLPVNTFHGEDCLAASRRVIR